MEIEYRNEDEDFTEYLTEQSDEDELREDDNRDRAQAIIREQS